MHKYKGFIRQNIAPNGAKRIGVYDSKGEKVCDIPLGRLTRPNTEKLYSFGIVSDIHISHAVGVAWNPREKFDNALTMFESKGCAMCIATGDLTNTGFYLRTSESTAGTEYLDERQFSAYKAICDKHTIPVYELMGNHESYYGMPISNNLALMEKYTGKGVLSYTIEQGNDLFILCGQPHGSVVMTDADFTWLSETIAANTDKRCFVFIHPYIEEDSGDPLDVRENSIFDDKYWGEANRNAFINLLNQYPNVILFHGHSHMKFEYQQYDVNANYTERNGFKSVHIPSLATPRDINFDTMKSKDDTNGSQGYIVDVYDDCIVLNGWDFVGNKSIPLGTYKIDT